MTDRLPATPEGIAAAAEMLRTGGVVAFPTDTVYGVGCSAAREDRVGALFELKQRPVDKLIPILVAGLDQVSDEWLVDDRARTLAERFWPGALTLVLPSLHGDRTQAFRAPDHPVAQALVAAAGPLLTTSANISGQPDTLDADDVLIAFATSRDGLDAVVDGGRVQGGIASSVIDLSRARPRLLRDAALSRTEIEEVIGSID